MHRLLKISFDQALLSLTPILSWFCLSLILDSNLINIFTLVYPLQYIYYIIDAPLAGGANISRIRDKNPNAVMSGLILGTALTIIVYGFILLNLDSYITYMNMGITTYRTFAIYAIILLIYQTIFSIIITKLYYEDQNSKANRYSVIFNILCFVIVNSFALLTKNQQLTVYASIIIIGAFLAYLFIRNLEKFHFKLNLYNCIKYSSVECANYFIMFFIFLFGLSHATEYGPQYTLAITFVALITDTQWDVLDSINAAAKIDITKKRFNYKQSVRNAYKLVFLLLSTVALMFIGLSPFYELDIKLTLFYLSFEIIMMLIDPLVYLYTCYLQLNWSPAKAAGNKLIARAFRFGVALLPTPFCTSLSGLASSLYQIVVTRYLFYRNYTVKTNGHIHKRHRRPQNPAPQLQTRDIIIDEETIDTSKQN